jgi:hypothetical protein
MSDVDRTRSAHPSSVYPLHPPDSRLVFRYSQADLTCLDKVAVAASSLFIVGSVVWVPVVCVWAWRRWRAVNDPRRRTLYGASMLACLGLVTHGPHRTPDFATRWLQVRKWRLWSAWLKFIAMEVIADSTDPADSPLDIRTGKAVLAFVPHGIFPFAFAFCALPEAAQRAFGSFRPVVATATNFLPVVSDFLLWLGKV